ncbi:MAG: hypothetical protein HYZ27_04245 [Deltaproteobacteria bacterium]|nr:hypothetical protein [Deltaproteobacteria bacterium]
MKARLLCTLFPLVAACGPGRQAAWEKPAGAAATAPTGDAASLTAQAEEAWKSRGERTSCETVVAALVQLTAQNPHDAKALAWLSRAYYLLADGHLRLANENDAMLATFEKGVEAGERAMMASSTEFAAKVKAGAKVEEAVKLIPAEGQEPIYWYASNLGKFAVAKGFTTTLFYKDRIFAVMQRVLEIDEKFFHAAPHRYFGAFYAKAPSFAGGDLGKSKLHFDRALELDPNYFGTKVLYAEFYAPKTEDKTLFAKLLEEVTAGNPEVLPELVPEQKLEQQKAKKLLAEINEIF